MLLRRKWFTVEISFNMMNNQMAGCKTTYGEETIKNMEEQSKYNKKYSQTMRITFGSLSVDEEILLQQPPRPSWPSVPFNSIDVLLPSPTGHVPEFYVALTKE